MKKYVLILTMVCMVGGLFVGCGKKKEETKEEDKKEATEATEEVVDMPSMEKVDYDKAIKLGKYKGLEVSKTITPVTDEMVDTEIKNALAQAPAEVGEGEVAGEGDVVNIDYEGKLDGVAFDGGTDTGADLTLGSGTFIPGFEDQLIGVTKGQTLDITVTFPDDYQNKDMAGKTAVFTVKVNAISRAAEAATDEWVAANTDYKTVDEYRAGMKKQLEESYDSSADQQAQDEAFAKVLETSKVKESPKELLEYGEKQYKDGMEQQAQMYGVEVKELLKGQNVTEEQYNEDAKKQGEEFAKQMLVFGAIAEKEGFKKSDKEYKKVLDDFITQTGLKTEEELVKNYGKNTIHQNVLVQMVLEFVIAEAKVNEVEATPAPEVQLEQPAEEAPAEEAPAEETNGEEAAE